MNPNSARHGRPDEGGFSLIEITIATAMLMTLIWLVATLSTTGMRSQRYTERMARVTEIAQDVIDEMRGGLTSSVRVFGNDTVGENYRAILAIPADMRGAIDSTRLPAVRATALLEPDVAADPRTGNCLMFARYAWTDEFESAAGNVYRVDVYRLEWWYLTIAGTGPERDRPDGINLAKWASEPLADGTQIDRIADPTDRAEVLIHMFEGTPDRHGLEHDPVSVIWLVGADPAVDGTLRQIDAVGDLSNTPHAPRTTTWEIEAEPSHCRSDILDYRHHSIASCFAPRAMGVGRFGIVDPTGDGFPNGLEVQVVGPSSSRQVLLHLSVVSTRTDDHRAFYDIQLIADVRDM
ncbi:MAG: hypothetical protein IPM29_03555 [Planctomycetes bacterium]|nr:hypothetical protein [Planctomycetota bacterium]